MNRSLSEYQGLLGRYLRPQRARVILLAALLLGSIGLQLLSPQIIRAFIDTTQAGGAGDTLLIAAGIFIAAGLAQRVVALATLYVGENVGWNATNALRADLAHIVEAASETARRAGVAPEGVDVLYFTGGSTGLTPLVDRIAARFPAAAGVRGDRYASVAQGLGLHARALYGPAGG